MDKKDFSDKEQCEWSDTSLKIAPLSRGSGYFSLNFLSTYIQLWFGWGPPPFSLTETLNQLHTFFSLHFKQHFLSAMVHSAKWFSLVGSKWLGFFGGFFFPFFIGGGGIVLRKVVLLHYTASRWYGPLTWSKIYQTLSCLLSYLIFIIQGV